MPYLLTLAIRTTQANHQTPQLPTLSKSKKKTPDSTRRLINTLLIREKQSSSKSSTKVRRRIQIRSLSRRWLMGREGIHSCQHSQILIRIYESPLSRKSQRSRWTAKLRHTLSTLINSQRSNQLTSIGHKSSKKFSSPKIYQNPFTWTKAKSLKLTSEIIPATPLPSILTTWTLFRKLTLEAKTLRCLKTSQV